jgi:hypothetical protein
VQVGTVSPVCAPGTIDITTASLVFGSTNVVNYNYWSNAAGTVAVTTPTAVAVSGTYYIEGDSAVESGTIDVNPLPVPTISGTQGICERSTVAYTTAGMSNYLWSISSGGMIVSGDGTEVINVLWSTAGTHSVSVNYTNANGCLPIILQSYLLLFI